MAGAFSFQSAPFGAAPTPAFGASSSTGFGFGAPAAASAPAFGTSSTPAFGAAASAPAFGASAPSSSTISFGGFGTPAAPSAAPFGAPAASSAPAFGFSSAPQSGGAFGFGAAPQAATTSSAGAFGGGGLFQSAPAAAPFGQQPGALLSQPQQQQAQQAFAYSTKFDDLPADMQRQLTQIQEEISRHDKDSKEVDQTPHMQDASALRKDLNAETSSLKEALRAMQGSIRADNEAMADFRQRAMRLLKSTESVVRTFQRTKLWRDAPQQYKGQVLPPMLQELLASPVLLPAPFLEQAVDGFQQNIDEYKKTLAELEQALSAHAGADVSDMNVLETLPTIISNMHEYFVHVAAKMERADAQVQRARTAYLTRLRQQGDPSDPFERVRRQQEHEQQHTRRLHAGSGSYQPQGQQSQQQANGGTLSLIMPGGGTGTAGQAGASPFTGASPSGSAFMGGTPQPGAYGVTPDAGANLSRSASKTSPGQRKKRY